MRIEQLRESGETRPPLTASNFDGVTRAHALRDLLVKADFEMARARERETEKPVNIDTRVSRFVVNVLLAAGMLGLLLRGMAVAHGQERTITILHGTITMSGPAPTSAEAAAVMQARATSHATPSRYDGPWLVVAPCWSCDVQRLRDARDELTRLPWWSSSRGRSFYGTNVDPWRRSGPRYRKQDRTVIGRRPVGERTTNR